MTTWNNTLHPGKIYPPVGSDLMLLEEFSGTEAVNEMSLFRVRGITQKPVDLNKYIGMAMRVELQTAYDTKRQFHQIIFSARDLGCVNRGTDDEVFVYEFELRPWIWAASRAETSRIFHKKTVEKIIREALGNVSKLGNCSLEFKINNPPPELEYTVQYCETDLNFVLRLMEEFGWNYHCNMGENDHSIFISNHVDDFAFLAGKSRSHFGNQSLDLNQEYFSAWLPQRNFTTGRTRALDYDFATSGKPDIAQSDSVTYNGSDLESFEYTGRIASSGNGHDIVKRRLEAQRTADAQVRAGGSCLSLGAGMKVKVTGANPAAENGTYVCLSANHHYVHGAHLSQDSSENSYDGAYLLTRDNAPIAPTRVTPRTRMQGPQTATVIVGAHDGVDEFGRIKVRFHWQSDTADSMYCRVSQLWAGSGWGGVFIPQVGMEVIVEFLSGDPDQPIVTGCIYNKKNMPPWKLPGKNKISGIKTVTANQFSFDDTQGSELIEMIGTKDMKVHIKNNETVNIDQNQTIEIGGKLTETVTGEIVIESRKKITLKVGASKIEIDQMSIKIEAASIEIAANLELKTKGGVTAEHSGGVTMTIKGAMVMIN